jgi:hypothetical protein
MVQGPSLFMTSEQGYGMTSPWLVELEIELTSYLDNTVNFGEGI